jgi:CheY-like chemotaxis protein
MSGRDTIDLVAPTKAAPIKTHLLVVEDEPVIRELFSTLLQAAGYSVAQAQDGFAALEEVRRRRPALILSDLNMPRMTGFELLSVIRRRFPSVHVIAMSGAFSSDKVPPGVAADAFYQKSGRHISTLVDVIEDLLKSAAADNPNRSESSPEPANKPSVALWVSRRGTPIEGPYILLTCSECLRSFPHPTGEETTMNVSETSCIFCNANISYALLDPSITHHPGYAPSHTP